MTKLLALDTSTSSTILGLKLDGKIVDGSTCDVKTHSRNVLPDIHQLVSDAGIELGELDAIVFGQGPGSFTGLRIAVGIVQGLGYGLGIPLVPVSSMACIARSSGEDGQSIFVGLAARLEEIYYGAYKLEPGKAVAVLEEGVTDVSLLPHLPAADWIAAGDGVAMFREKIEASTGAMFSAVKDDCVPDLEQLLDLGETMLAEGQTVAAMEASPVYLREKVADRPNSQ